MSVASLVYSAVVLGFMQGANYTLKKSYCTKYQITIFATHICLHVYNYSAVALGPNHKIVFV